MAALASALEQVAGAGASVREGGTAGLGTWEVAGHGATYPTVNVMLTSTVPVVVTEQPPLQYIENVGIEVVYWPRSRWRCEISSMGTKR